MPIVERTYSAFRAWWIGYSSAVTEEFEPGDKVEWNSSVSKGAKKTVVKGVVGSQITEPTTIDGHTVNASPDDPKYVVETKSGEAEAHGGSALRKED